MHLSVKMWAGGILMFITMMLSLASLATPTWVQGSQGTTNWTLGVWEACMDASCVSVYSDKSTIIHAVGGWLYAVQATTLIAFLMFVFTTAATLLVYNLERFSGKYSTLMFLSVVIFIAVIIYGYAVFLYGYEAERKLFYAKDAVLSFGLAFYLGVGTIMTGLASGILYFLDYKDQTNTRSSYMVLN